MKVYWPYPITMIVSLHYIYLALVKFDGWRGFVFCGIVLSFAVLVVLSTDLLNSKR